jgi:hypothetical protein
MMLAFHGDPAIKRKYLRRVRAHAKADEIIRGKYWEDGKGCAVGCTIHGAEHETYETELGIPIALAQLEDTLFECQSNGKAKTFPARFLAAINPGADLSRVQWQFLHWLLTEELAARDHPLVAAAIKQCARALVPLTKGMPVDKSAAASAAWSAERSAASAAWSAERSAVSAVASAASAASAAWSAEMSAVSAVESAASAAWSAASAAESAASAAWSAASAAESAASAAYARMADKLIELLAAVPSQVPAKS